MIDKSSYKLRKHHTLEKKIVGRSTWHIGLQMESMLVTGQPSRMIRIRFSTGFQSKSILSELLSCEEEDGL